MGSSILEVRILDCMATLTYLLVLKERGFLDTSLGCATSGLTIPPCPFKVSPCPMATLPKFYHKAVLEGLS